MKKTVWKQIMELETKDTRHKGLANNLTPDELETIYATADFFGAGISLIKFDLQIAKYRVFDWLAMGVNGRLGNTTCAKVFAHSFLKCEGNIDKFIEDLRITDYEIDTSFEAIELEQNA